MDIQDLIWKAGDSSCIRVDLNTERDVDIIIKFCEKAGIFCLNGATVKHGKYTKDGGVKVGVSVFIGIEILKEGDLRCIAFARVTYKDSGATLIPSESLLPYRNIKRGHYE